MLNQLRLALSPVFSFRRGTPHSWSKLVLGGAALLGLIWVWPHGTAHGSKSIPPAVLNLKDGTTLIPESERPLDICVIGVDPSGGLFCFLPYLQPEAIPPSRQFQEIHRQLYWLNFEISHGRLLNSLPKSTQVFVALPDPQSVKQADGTEKGLFRDYLKARCGWTQADIQARIHFFKTPVPVGWTQDIGKILGRDAQGRWIISRGSNDQTGYRESVGALCQAFPDRFTYRDLPAGVSAEGGDEDLVRTPEGSLAFLVGRHRASRYLEWSGGQSLNDQVLTQDDLMKAQDLFSGAFNGLPVVFIPSRVLENPSLGNNELFHLDMSVAVLSVGGKSHAFVPSYIDHPVDRVTGTALDPSFVKSLQTEYDLMASELSSMGYPVDRLAVTDHPVRSPANLVRYYDPATGHCTILLAKYPYNLPGSDGSSPQNRLMESLQDIREKGEAWHRAPDDPNFQQLQRSIETAWQTMDWASYQQDPFFDQNREIFQKAGVDVVAVPDFAWGSGGLHCQLLH